jgi:hypothetical protein
MSRNKLNFYKISTGCKGLSLYDLFQSPDFVELKKQRSVGVTATGQVLLPETKHTEDMMAEAFVEEADDEGVIEFDLKEKAQAKMVLRGLGFMAGLSNVHSEDPDAKDKLDANNKKLIALWNKVLDKSSPRDIIDELTKELEVNSNPKTRKMRIEEQRAATAKTTKA